MAIIRIETRFDQAVRDLKYWGKGFCAGSAATFALVGCLFINSKVKQYREEQKTENENKEES